MAAILKLACAAAVVMLAALPAVAAPQYPTRPITIVVPFAAGGTNDILARAIGKSLTTAWGQPVVIDNRPGGGGTIGILSVAKAAPDGHMLLLVSPSLAIHPAVRVKPPFHPVDDFAPVALIGRGPMVLAGSPKLPASTLADLIALARAKPDLITYASSGPGSVNHVAAELLNVAADIKLAHIPYRGGSLAINDLLAGHVDLYVSSLPQIIENVRTGRVKGLAVTGAHRSPAAPDLPTMAEAGLPGYDMDLWWGVVAPANTPRGIVEALNTEINKALATAELQEFLRREGAEPKPASPEEFGALIATEYARWQKVAAEANIRVD